MTDFIHSHVHALYVVDDVVVTEAGRLVLMTHEETQVVGLISSTQCHVHRAEVTRNVKDGGGCGHALLILAKGYVSKRGL